MTTHNHSRIIARLGDDMNWWLDRVGDELVTDNDRRAVLDPRQVAHLVEALEVYYPHGLRRQQFTEALEVFEMENELEEGQLRLAASNESIFETSAQLFALPRTDDEGKGGYDAFLDALGSAHIRKLNTTHHFAHKCTEDEMIDELRAVDAGRYFSDDTIHVFDEITEILEWNPAEWDDSSSASS